MQYETFTMPEDPDQALFVYSTEAGTASRDAMTLLASWALSQRSAPVRSDAEDDARR